MTIKLYYDNLYLKEFDSKVEKIEEIDGKYHVVLQRTAFYPEGGGQPCDIGTIDGLNVIYVYEKDDLIYHVMEEKINKDKVRGIIDFNRRFDYMQQHTGEHILSGVFKYLYGANNDSFHLGEEYVSIDIDIKNLTKDMVSKVEDIADSVISMDLPVKTYVVDDLKTQEITLRKKVNVEKNIRVVQIGNFDFSGCCGTHVENTCQVETIKILKWENYKGKTRVYFKCGERVNKDYNKKHEILSTVYQMLGCKLDQVIPITRENQTAIKSLNKEVKDLKEKIVFLETKEILRNLGDEKLINITFKDETLQDIELYIKEINKNKECIILALSETDKQVVLTYNGDFAIECGKMFKENIKSFDGKGGGNKKRAQGVFESNEKALEFYNFLLEKIQ